MIKNQPVAALRRTTVFINQDDGVTPIARNTLFTGRMFLDKGDANYVAAAGTLTNKRYPLTGANFTYTVNIGTNNLLCHAVAHGLQIIDGPFRPTNAGGALPTGQSAVQDYWVTPVGADDFKISTTLTNALAGVYVVMTSNGTGVQTWNFQAGTQRGIDGDFQYEFTLAETNQIATFLTFFIPGLAGTNAPARSIVPLDADAIGFDAISESGHTHGDLIRGIASVLFGLVSGFNTSTPQWRSLDNTKSRIQGTVDATGRPSVTILDLTP